jgi:oxygen-dependent protoporphyrinogen oxidase
VLVRAFIGRAGQQGELSGDDASLIRIALSELRNVLGVTGTPERSRVFRWDRGMPQYNLGHLDRIHRIELGIGRVPGMEIAGNMFRGVGIPDCIASGEAAADNTLVWLNEIQPVGMMAGSGR